MHSSQSSGRPKFKREAGGAIWILQTGYTNRINSETFVSDFCYLFEDYLKWYEKDFSLEDLEIFPLGIVSSAPNSLVHAAPGKVTNCVLDNTRYLAGMTLDHLRKDDDKKTRDKEWSAKFDKLTSLAVKSCSCRPWEAIIFRVYNPSFNLMKNVERFLIGLNYCCSIGSLNYTTHYQIDETKERVTFFGNDCGSG